MMRAVLAVERHREVVRRALVDHGFGPDEVASLVAQRDLDADVRLSGVLVLLADTADVPYDDGAGTPLSPYDDPSVDWLGRDRGAWAHLASLTLPWSAATAVVAVDLVTGCPTFDDRRVNLALRGAGQVCEAGLATTQLLDSLDRLRAYLGGVGDHEHRIAEMRSRVTRVIASASPPGLLDLSPLLDGDTWAPAARAAARDLPADDVDELVRVLVSLGPRKPTKTWLRDTRAALEAPAAQQLLRRWLQAAAAADVVPEIPGSSLAHVLGVLFMSSNNDVVRAAVWATSLLPDESWLEVSPTTTTVGEGIDAGALGSMALPWPAEALGVLARRGSAHNGLPRLPEALALKVAGAAVDVLISSPAKAAVQVLEELLEDLTRRTLVTKIGNHLGRSDEAAQRTETRAKERAREQRRKANHAPRKARSAQNSMLRAHLGATLRAGGFSGGPTTWKRDLEHRVERIVVYADVDHGGRNSVDLGYGAHFRAIALLDEAAAVSVEDGQPGRGGGGAHDAPVAASATEPSGRDTSELHLDVFDALPHHGGMDAFSPEGLAILAAWITDVVIPFLNSLDDYDTALAAFEGGSGLPPGGCPRRGPDSFSGHERAGSFALAHSDGPTAVKHLAAAAILAEAFRDEGEPGDDWADHTLTVVRWKLARAEILG